MYRRSRRSKSGAALVFAVLILFTCPFFLYRGLTFHLADRGPGTIDNPFTQQAGRGGYDYGGYLTVTSTGKSTKESDGPKDNIYNLLEDAGSYELPVQHIEVDTADQSPYSFQYQGRTYHVEGSRDTELTWGFGALILGGLLGAGGLLGIRTKRRRRLPAPIPG